MTFRERMKSFMTGMGQVLQIYPEQLRELSEYSGPINFNKYASEVWRRDCAALAEDCRIAGKDIENAVRKSEGLK